MPDGKSDRPPPPPGVKPGGWIPGTNPPQWSDNYYPVTPEPWIPPLVDPAKWEKETGEEE